MNLIQESFEQMFHFYLLENKIQSLDPGWQKENLTFLSFLGDKWQHNPLSVAAGRDIW